MSLFSLATQDKASWIAKLDGNLEEINGNGLLTSTCTITGTPTFELSSATAGSGSYLFNQDPGQEMLYFTATRSSSLSGSPVFETVVKIGTPPVLTTVNDRVIVRGETTDGFGSRTLGVRIQANGTISNPFYTAANSGTTTFQVISNININDGQWHHLMAFESLVNNNTKLDLYVDGVLSATGTSTTNIGREQPNNLRIGSRSTGTTFGFYGLIDFAAVYNQGYLLTPTFDSARVTAHYNNFLSTRDTYVAPTILPYETQIGSLNPKIWYKFNETAGSPVNSGSLSNTLTAVGTPLQNEQTEIDGRCIYLNGTSRYDLSPLPAFSLFDDKSFSIEMWVKASATDVSSQYQPQLFTVNHATAANRYITLEFVGSAFGGSTGKISWEVVNGSGTSNSVLTTQTYNDNNWHHIVATLNTTSMKLYVDGTLKASKNVSYGTFDFDTSPLGKKFIGNSYRGRIDEFAVYDYELTPQQILSNYNSGSSVAFADQSGNASALMVMPAFSVQTVLTADPMTASSTSGDHYNSTVEFPTLLNTYMSGLTLQTWFKFDKTKTLTDYGTEPTRASTWGNLITNNPTGGVQGSGELVLLDDANSINLIFQNVPATTGIAALLNDEDFTIGFWTKKLVKEQAFIFYSFKSDGTQSVNFQWNSDGGISFVITTNNTNHTIASTTDITDGEWHFVVGKLSSGTMQLWVDNTSIGTTTMNQNLSLDYFQFETTVTDKVHVSQFFVTTSAAIGTTQIANIWDYGTPTSVQASAYMPEAVTRFNSAFNDYIESKNPVLDFRLDEPTGNPSNYGSGSISLVPYLNPQGFTQNEIGLNNRAFKFTDRSQATRGSYSFNSGTFSTDDLCTIGVVFKIGNATNQQGIVGFGGRNTGGLNDGNGFSLQMLASSGYLRIQAGNNNGTVTSYTGTTNYADGKWHLAVIVKEASTVKLYVDGKEHVSSSNSTQMTDTGEFIIGGIAGIVASSLSVDKMIDEVFVTNTAFTAQEVFEAWQKLRLEMDTTATASLPMPTNIAGTGTTQTVDEATASSLFEMPTFNTEQILNAAPGTASALFVLPNFGGNVVIDANYGHTSATASAVFHMPQYNIGEFNSADHMNASALMVHPTSISGGQISVSTHIGGPATFVMPGIVTIKGARVFAEPARARSIFPLPPAYIQLSDDQWYVRLLEGHADRLQEAPQTVGTGTNLPNQPTTDVIKGGFLTFFDDINGDITPTTTIKTIKSEIPAFYFTRADAYSYDQNGNILPPNTTKAEAEARATRQSSNPTPRLGFGYFDPFERKAVRVENIEFPLPGTTSQNSQRPYNLEFSIRTTKQDQILAHGLKTSALYNSRTVGVIGLSDGKIYLAEDGRAEYSLTGPGIRGLYAVSAPHPKKFKDRAQYLLSRKSIADGQWHHVIIQRGWNDGRTQIWIDGQLDRQFGVQVSDGGDPSYTNIPGLDGTNTVRPYILGFNSNEELLYSDFETSAWNFYPGRFLTTQQITLNNAAYLKYEPIKPEPMTATLAMTQNNIGKGNRSRMLLLYWWQNRVGYNQFVTSTSAGITTGYDGNNSPFSPENLIDNPKVGPQDYYGWDVFPVSVTGRTGTSDIFTETVRKTNAGYVDIETGSYRMLDLQKDLDLSQFDMIMFANYPTTSAQLDEFIREEFIDDYFGTTEKDVYFDFLKSLRKAVDSGISLFVQFDQLARDLNIYNKVDRIPVFKESDLEVFDGSDLRAIETTSNSWNTQQNKPNIIPAYPTGGERSRAYFPDRANNMRHRIVNTKEFLTDDATFIWTDHAYYQANSELDFTAPDRRWDRYEYRINGLEVGAEFIFGNPSGVTAFGNLRAKQDSFLAVPFENVLAGKIITAQPEKYYKRGELVDNPYKNYAHSIALDEGDMLDGKPLGGKIFVSIAETFWDYTDEERFVDLYSDYWIDMIYNLGFFGKKQSEGGDGTAEAERDQLKNSDQYISPVGLTQENYNHATYWSRNDDFVFVQIQNGGDLGITLGLFFNIEADVVNRVSKTRASISSLPRRRDAAGRFASGSGSTSGGLFFQISNGRTTKTSNVYVPNLLTRGMLWLSDRIRPSGLVLRAESMSASTRFQPANPVVDKDVNINSSAMLSNANIGSNITGTITREIISITLTTLPLTSSAFMPALGKQILPDEFLSNARMVMPGVFAYSLEEVVLKIENNEAVLYIKGDKIR
jgi:hypothetical protein